MLELGKHGLMRCIRYSNGPEEEEILNPGLQVKFGAGDGDQTRDLRLGKPTLYQLSYTRITDANYTVSCYLSQVKDAKIAGHTLRIGPKQLKL